MIGDGILQFSPDQLKELIKFAAEHQESFPIKLGGRIDIDELGPKTLRKVAEMAGIDD